MPYASFMKHTSHAIQKDLKESHPETLELFKVEKIERRYQFWQREALPICLYTPEIVYQKLDYIHNNP
jgi:putative transposase